MQMCGNGTTSYRGHSPFLHSFTYISFSTMTMSRAAVTCRRCSAGGNSKRMKNYTEKRTKVLILGIGNVLMGDEGIGVHVINAVEKAALPPGVDCLDGGTGSFLL